MSERIQPSVKTLDLSKEPTAASSFGNVTSQVIEHYPLLVTEVKLATPPPIAFKADLSRLPAEEALQLQRNVYDLNMEMRTLWLIENFAIFQRDQILSENTLDSQNAAALLQRLCRLTQTFHRTRGNYEAPSKSHTTAIYFETDNNIEANTSLRAAQHAMANSLGLENNTTFPLSQEIIVTSPNDLEPILAQIPNTLHDLGNAVHEIANFATVNIRAGDTEGTIEPYLDDAFVNLRRITETGNERLTAKYTHETLTPDEIQSHIDGYFRHMLSRAQVKNLDVGNLSELGDIDWSKAWLTNFLYNIAQNEKKVAAKINATRRNSYQPEMKVYKRKSIDDEGQTYKELVFEDNGPGFDPEVITKGFAPGLTKLSTSDTTGHGLGLSGQPMQEYNIKLYPENVVDEENSVTGGRVVLRFGISDPALTIDISKVGTRI